jgi:cobalamin biosynthesis Mg chelatase CobN
VQSLQYWLGGNPENLENLLLNAAAAYVPAVKGVDFSVAVRSPHPPSHTRTPGSRAMHLGWSAVPRWPTLPNGAPGYGPRRWQQLRRGSA